MNVAQVVPCLGNRSGGPSRSVYNLSKGLRDCGLLCEILTCNYQDDINIVKEDWIKTIDLRHRKPFEYAPGFYNLMHRSEYDLYHIHSIYTYPVTVAGIWAKKKRIPYIIAPRGSLFPNALLGSSRRVKKWFNSIILTPLFNDASVIHATSVEEKDVIRGLGFTAPIAVIPNSFQVDSFKYNKSRSVDGLYRLGFIGRINPIKNLDGLLRSWSKCGLGKNSKAELVIVGGTRLQVEIDYLASLHKLEEDLDIQNIKWTGALEGEAKNSIMNSFSFLILPSHSENFGMVVLESLIQGVPVIASKGTPWKMLEDVDCGFWVNNDDDSLSEVIYQSFLLSESVKNGMGDRASTLAESTFSSAVVSKKMIQLYEWILNGGEAPEFVFF